MAIPTTPEELGKELETIRAAAVAGSTAAEKHAAQLVTIEAGLRAIQLRQAEAATYKADGPEASVRRYVVPPEEIDDVKRAPRQHRQTASGVVRVLSLVHEDGGIEHGLLDDPRPESPWQHELQRAVTDRALVRGMLRPDSQGRVSSPISDRRVRRLLRNAPDAVRRVFADDTGIGAEWIPDTTLPEIERTLELQQRIGGLFDVQPVSPKTGSLILPFLSTGLRPYLKKKATTDDPAAYPSSTLSTANRTYDVQSWSVRQQIDEDATEDSIIDALALGRQEVVDALVDGTDDRIMNGDTTLVHQDAIATWDIRGHWGAAGLGTAADHRRGDIGLRARAFDVANTTDQSAAQDVAGFAAARAKLAAAHALGDCVAIVSPEYFLLKMLTFADFMTWEKAGAAASILTGMLGQNPGPLPGQVGWLFGVPVVVSWFMSADLAATGLFTGAGTKTGMVICNRSRFKRFVKRGARIELDKDITRGVIHNVITSRDLFDTLDKGTSTKNVHFSFNLTGA